MSEPRFNWAMALLLLLACGIAYINTLDGEWVWDDASSVLLHKHVQQPSQLFQLFREDQHAFGRGQGNFYRPLVSVSFLADYLLSGGPKPGEYDENLLPEVSPLLFHISNMFWHYCAALALLLLLHTLNAPRFVKGLVPLLFVVHPLHTEAVAYISGRADMMSAIGIFAALCFAIRATQLKQPLFGTIAAALFFIAGLVSKESTLIYPVLLGVLFLTTPAIKNKTEQDEEPEVSPHLRYAPLVSAVAILALYLLLRSTVLRFADSQSTAAAPLTQRLFETFQSLGLYAQMLFLPTGLHMERTLDGISSLYTVAGGLFFLGLPCRQRCGMENRQQTHYRRMLLVHRCMDSHFGYFPVKRAVGGTLDVCAHGRILVGAAGTPLVTKSAKTGNNQNRLHFGAGALYPVYRHDSPAQSGLA